MDENELVKKYEKLIYLGIKNLHIYWKTNDEFQDYVDSGYDGIIKGIRTYDSTKDVKQSTYVYTCIETELKRRIYLNTMNKRSQKVISLNLLANDLDDTELIDLIPSDVDVEKEIETKIDNEKLLDLVNHLPIQKDRYVIKLFFGLDGYEPMNCNQIAKRWGVNKNMIIARKNRALGILWRRIKEKDLWK